MLNRDFDVKNKQWSIDSLHQRRQCVEVKCELLVILIRETVVMILLFVLRCIDIHRTKHSIRIFAGTLTKKNVTDEQLPLNFFEQQTMQS